MMLMNGISSDSTVTLSCKVSIVIKEVIMVRRRIEVEVLLSLPRVCSMTQIRRQTRVGGLVFTIIVLPDSQTCHLKSV